MINKQNIKHESGRSMVEMLGVLAIIGVLSIGGIYGYKLAMTKIQDNAAIETFNSLFLMTQEARDNSNSILHCCTGSGVTTSSSCAATMSSAVRNQISNQIKFYVSSKYHDKGTSCYGFCGSDNYSDSKFTWEFNPYDYYAAYIQLGAQSPSTCKTVLNAVRFNKDYQENFKGFGVIRSSHFGILYSGLDKLTDANIEDVCTRVKGTNNLVSFTVYYDWNGKDCEF